jgi:adenosylcobinamide-GDP ribazoletransferase
VLLTGAFHEDGLADLADGLGGSPDRERALDIMKDSRIGSYGSVALVLAFLAKTGMLVLLAQCRVELAAAALFGAHVTSRLMPLFIVRTLPHVGDTARSKSKPLADQISRLSLLAALLWALPALALANWLLPGAWWLAGVLGALAGLAWMWRLLQRRLGGFTGDALGATQQLSEMLFYLGLLLALPPSLT